ncbi:MAG: hypothetical protein AB1652_03885 [Bacillota bacterium]
MQFTLFEDVSPNGLVGVKTPPPQPGQYYRRRLAKARGNSDYARPAIAFSEPGLVRVGLVAGGGMEKAGERGAGHAFGSFPKPALLTFPGGHKRGSLNSLFRPKQPKSS